MVKYMKVNGTRVLNMVMGFGKELKVNHILASGSTVKRKASVSTHGKMEISTKECGFKT